MQDKAAALLPAVLGLYKTGAGVWNAYHMDGTLVELRHCVDFIYVGNALQSDLTPAQKSEMIAFVKRELFMRDWMRAMSQQDAAAANSDRPDHGPMGAYDGWIPLTVGTMWRLGDPAGAYEFYRRTAVVTKEGPFAQAREFYGPNKTAYDAPVRVAKRRGCMKECISGVAFADVVHQHFLRLQPIAGRQFVGQRPANAASLSRNTHRPAIPRPALSSHRIWGWCSSHGNQNDDHSKMINELKTSNYDKFPFVSVPNGANACVAGWDTIAEKLRQAIAKRASRKTVLVVECYTGVDEDEVLRELQSRLKPALALRANEAMLPPEKIDALVAPFLGGNDPVFGFLSGLKLPEFFDDGEVCAVSRERLKQLPKELC